MSNYPNALDDDTTLPIVNDNLSEIGGDAINALRDAVFNLEQTIGLNPQGTTSSLAARLGVFINPDGSPNFSIITSLGLVTLPIYNDQIAERAGIVEGKLRLNYPTQDLFNYIRDLSKDVNLAIDWISVSGTKLEPHLVGAIYRHDLRQIDVAASVSDFLNNKFRVLRDNTDSYTLVNDMNNELLAHQWADGSPFGVIQNVVTNNGSVYPSNYGHTASGIFLNTTRFTTIPQTAEDLQLFAEFIDSSSLFLLGTRIQNLYSNGISRASRSSSLGIDGYGYNLVPVTPAIAYLKNIGNSSSPFDDIDTGDDIIEFKPSAADLTSNSFDAKFALVKVGDIIRINYGTIEVPFVIKEKKYSQTGGPTPVKKFLVRVTGKNLFYSPNAVARIDRPLFNLNKFGVLAISPVNNVFAGMPSLIVTDPRGGEALGVGFDPSQLNEKHYLLYIALYTTGFPQDGYTILPAIDVTGNQGITPGLYTLDSVVESTNAAFRKAGYNYRFVAFSYQGEFGIALADSYNNASFSVLSAVVADNGTYDQTATVFNFPNNVVDLFPTVGSRAPDPLGFGPFGANIASPPFRLSYGSPEASQNPTKLFVPLNRNNFYVNGIEKDRLTLEVGQALDGYGDGYWVAQVIQELNLSGHVQTTYRIPLDLSTSTLKVGKTVVIQSLGAGSLVDFGRFIIQNVTFGCCPTTYTDITVYDAVHAKGFSPTPTIGLDGYVALYFNSDSVSFNIESATDFTSVSPFKRHFEVYVDQNSNTFTLERGRIPLIGGSFIVVNSINVYSNNELAKLDIVRISPKLRGYQFSSVNKIALQATYSTSTNILTGQLGSWDGVTFTHAGPTVSGKKGEIIRFYDETNIDYIDIILDVNTVINAFTNQIVDFQLFPTLSLDDEVMMIGTCQVNDTTKKVNKVRDERQFGATSEKDLSTSALNFIAFPEKALHFNGVIRGFDITNITNEFITLSGGLALVNGKFQSKNNELFIIPKIKESYSLTFYATNWLLCINSIGELVIIPMTDYDSSVPTPNDPNRVFVAFNAVTMDSYNIDSTTFTYLLDHIKDLTPLYIITSTVTGTGPGATVALTSRDIRRFVNDQDSAMPIVITTDTAQGNFKNINTALNWIRFNNTLQNTIAIKGTATVTLPFTFTTGQLHFFSQGTGSLLQFNSSVNVSNTRFTDVPVITGGATTLTGVIAQNSSFSVNGNLIASSVDLTKSNGYSIFGTINASNSVFTEGSFQITSTATFTSSRIINHSSFGMGGASFGTCIINDIGTMTAGASSFTSSRLSNITSLTLSGAGTFTGCKLEDVGTMSITGAGNFTSSSNINNVTSLTITGAGTFTNTNVNNIPTISVGSGATFSNGTVNKVSGSVTGALSFTNNIVNDCSLNTTTNFTATSTNFTDLTSNITGTFTPSSCNFVNSTINVTSTASISSCKFNNCSVTITSTSTVQDCVFTNCNVVFTGAVTFNPMNTFVTFINCTLNFTNGGTFTNVTIDPSTINIGGTITPNNLTILDSTINISVVQGFTLTSNFRLERNNITWTGTPGVGYVATELVNSGNGMIWASVGASTLSNVTIRNNTFNTALQNHFPFFALQLTSYSSVVTGVNVSRNNFTSTASSDDVRAVIAVISTLTTRATVGVFPAYPSLIDVHFDDNTCNYNQMIIISAVRDSTAGYMNGAGVVVTDTTISRNVCGTIGYYISSAGPFDGTTANAGTPNNGIIRDKSNRLIIERNDCHFISNLDEKGWYICFRATTFPSNNVFEEVISTIGECSILFNNCNWIQVGAGGYIFGQSGVNIIGNTVSPSNKTFLNNFTSHTNQQSVTPGNVGIILRREYNAPGPSSSIISQNNLVQKYTSNNSPGVTITAASNATPIVITAAGHGFVDGQLVTISGVNGNTAANGTFVIQSHTATTFTLSGSVGNGAYTSGGVAVGTTIYYYDAGIACFNQARINSNVISGVVNSTTAPLMYFWDIASQIVTGNILERKGLNCSAFFYMEGLSGDNTAAQKLIIYHNEMDAADGSGLTNRYFIVSNPSSTTGYGTGAAASARQGGFQFAHNVAGVQPTFVFV